MDDLKAKIKDFPDAPGVYLMKDAAGTVLYVGKAKSLRNRVRSYFADQIHDERIAIESMMKEVVDCEYIQTASEVDALLTEARLIKDIQPKYNRSLRDGKLYPYLEITWGDDFPRVDITREATNRRSRYFGPFTDVRGLRRAAQLMQPIFRFRTCNLEIRRDDAKRVYHRPCLLYYIRRCTAPCADKIPYREYRLGIHLLVRFLQGKRARVIKLLQEQMKGHAEKLQYEQAARARDELRALESLGERGDLDSFPEATVAPVADLQLGLRELQELTGMARTPRRVDGIDIAHLGGTEAVGSLVSFVDAKPFKDGYRRYRIKDADTRDDFAMIHEVVSRRFKRLKEEDEAPPDILLIDGGPLQWASAYRAIVELGIEPPTILSLAKRAEEIYTHSHKPPIVLKRNVMALRLLQYVRDEAHRFAQHYHHTLRNKKLKQV